MFRFDNFMEEWAKKYKPIAHRPDEKKGTRFFRVNSEFTLDEFLQNYQDIGYDTPCCGIITHLEGMANVPKRLDYPTTNVLFLQLADENDYRAQADAKADCNLHMWKFLAYLHREVEGVKRSDRSHPLAQMDLEKIRYDMIGPITNWWFCQILTIQGINHTPVCYSETDYI